MSDKFWRWARVAAVAAYACVQAVLGFQDSPASDELRHLRDGTHILESGRVDVNPEHPPLLKLLSARGSKKSTSSERTGKRRQSPSQAYGCSNCVGRQPGDRVVSRQVWRQRRGFFPGCLSAQSVARLGAFSNTPAISTGMRPSTESTRHYLLIPSCNPLHIFYLE